MSTAAGTTKTLTVLSGGLDSAVALAMAERGPGSLALAVDYGQNNQRELICAKLLAKHYGVDLKIIGLSSFGAIINAGMTRPGEMVTSERSTPEEIPSAYTPARNVIFLSLALSIAERYGIQDIVVGFIKGQWTGDAQLDFLSAFMEMGRLGTECGRKGNQIKVHAPLLVASKNTVVRIGAQLKVPFQYTWSCHNHSEEPCEVCGACKQRKAAFVALGVSDPIYVYNHHELALASLAE